MLQMKIQLRNAILILGLIFGVFLLFVPSAHASSVTPVPHPKHTEAVPSATGGGCNPFSSSSLSGDIIDTGCISFQPFNLLPDGFAGIRPTSPVSSCRVEVQLFDSNGNFITSQFYSCVFSANVRYGPFTHTAFLGSYYSCIDVNIVYTNGSGSSAVNCSPFQNL